MRRPAAVLLVSIALGGAAVGQQSPFARSPSTTALTWSQMSLGNFMLLIQSRHAKIWYAGRSEDWALVAYEVDHVADDLTAAGMLYRDIPIELVTNADHIIARMKETARQKDPAGFQAAYSDLTRACNACHEAGGVPFIRIQTPTAMPFTNQKVQSSTVK